MCNFKGAKVLKFCPLLGAVKIFVLMGVDPPDPLPPRLHESAWQSCGPVVL